MTQEIEDKINKEARELRNPRNSLFFITGAKRGYELAMEDNSETWNRGYNAGIKQQPTPEPGKEYTREFVEEILEWVDGKYFQCDLYDEATDRHTKMWTTVYENEDNEPLRTTEELINQYLNSKK